MGCWKHIYPLSSGKWLWQVLDHLGLEYLCHWTFLLLFCTQGRVYLPEDFDDDSDDDYSEDEDMQSPIDDVDPFIFFMETVQGKNPHFPRFLAARHLTPVWLVCFLPLAVRASDPARFQSLMHSLDFTYQSLARSVAQHAEQRKLEREKEKLEKAALS